MRIISLVPSITELLYDLGLGESVVGITKFCIHPDEWFRSKTRVGGPKKLHIDIIQGLKPDLIIANKEENIREEVEKCETFCKVLLTNVSNYKEALMMIEEVGSFTNRKAKSIINEIEIAFSQLKRKSLKRAIYLIWKDPMMTIGGDTFINDMIERIVWTNIYSDRNRYPVITEQQLKDSKPDILLLSSEPYPFSQNTFPIFNKCCLNQKLFVWMGNPFAGMGAGCAMHLHTSDS